MRDPEQAGPTHLNPILTMQTHLKEPLSSRLLAGRRSYLHILEIARPGGGPQFSLTAERGWDPLRARQNLMVLWKADQSERRKWYTSMPEFEYTLFSTDSPFVIFWMFSSVDR